MFGASSELASVPVMEFGLYRLFDAVGSRMRCAAVIVAGAELFISESVEQPRGELLRVSLLLSVVPAAGQPSHGPVERPRRVRRIATGPHGPQQPRQVVPQLAVRGGPRRNRSTVLGRDGREVIFTEFTDASMPSQTILARVSTSFRRIVPTITTDKL